MSSLQRNGQAVSKFVQQLADSCVKLLLQMPHCGEFASCSQEANIIKQHGMSAEATETH